MLPACRSYTQAVGKAQHDVHRVYAVLRNQKDNVWAAGQGAGLRGPHWKRRGQQHCVPSAASGVHRAEEGSASQAK